MPPGKGYAKPKTGAMGAYANQPKAHPMPMHGVMHPAPKKPPKRKGK